MSTQLRQLVSVAAVIFFVGCSQDQPAPAPPKQVSAATPAADSAFESTLPQVRGPEGYVGSAGCRECHEDQYTSWHRSYHRTMTQLATEQSVQADFDNVVLTTESARFTLNKRSGEFWVRMAPLARPLTDENTAQVLEQRLGLVTGSHHMQVFWVPAGNGNVQLGFPFTWLIPEKRWVPRNSTFVRPPDLQHHAEVWNVVCSRCHTTGVEPHVNFAARSAETRVAELGISCEACHGPGERHVQAQKTARGTPKPGEVIHPRKITAERSAQTCGFCHSMKWMDKSNDWRENGFQFRPGDDLEQTTPVIRPSRVDSIPGLKDYLARNPDVLRDFFWPDGMIRVSGREFNGLLESPCYKGGKFSCVSCHSLHESEPDDQLAEKARGNGACLQCHDTMRAPAALAAHTHHGANSSGSDCYNCHMPHTSYGILKAIRSHQISSPKVADDLATGRPNACNLCHVDQTLAWTGTHLARWYKQPLADSPADKTNLSHIVDLALTGDAGQRVLAAWHLSWPPARNASATNWIPGVLGQLLDDPYAAVRCVAERSWKSNGLPRIPDYDYTIGPQSRAPVRDQIPQQVRTGQIDQERIDALLKRRNDLPVRLRE